MKDGRVADDVVHVFSGDELVQVLSNEANGRPLDAPMSPRFPAVLPARVEAPWTLEQAQALNVWQRAGVMHEFTCGKRDEHPEDGGSLIATEDGWVCPVPDCDYTQSWAHGFMIERGAALIRAVREATASG